MPPTTYAPPLAPRIVTPPWAKSPETNMHRTLCLHYTPTKVRLTRPLMPPGLHMPAARVLSEQ